jgi:hypothetical protein
MILYCRLMTKRSGLGDSTELSRVGLSHTYQQCMQHVFGDHIGRTVEAYVGDIVVKTRKADDLVSNLRVAFDCL